MSTTTPRSTFHIRLPEDLLSAIHAASAANGRTANAEMVFRLMESFGMSAGVEGAEEGSEGRVQTNVRLPVETISAIKAIAAANRRSFTAQLEVILREFVESQPAVAA